MSYTMNLREVDLDNVYITGKDLSIEERSTGKVYLSDKKYLDKLFDLMGYRNLNVINILEEYAGKTINEVADLKGASIFVDDVTDSFIVATTEAVTWIRNMLTFFTSRGFFIIEDRKYDPYYKWDQIIVQTPNKNYFAIYINLVEEDIYVLALDYDISTKKLTGVSYEGYYMCSGGDTSFDNLMVLMGAPIDISVEYTMDKPLSTAEYIELLKLLGYVKKGRKGGYYTTDRADELLNYVGDVSEFVDEVNCLTWLQAHITKPSNNATFKDACDLISINLDTVTPWDLKEFYAANAKEQSDFFLIDPTN